MVLAGLAAAAVLAARATAASAVVIVAAARAAVAAPEGTRAGATDTAAAGGGTAAVIAAEAATVAILSDEAIAAAAAAAVGRVGAGAVAVASGNGRSMAAPASLMTRSGLAPEHLVPVPTRTAAQARAQQPCRRTSLAQGPLPLRRLLLRPRRRVSQVPANHGGTHRLTRSDPTLRLLQTSSAEDGSCVSPSRCATVCIARLSCSHWGRLVSVRRVTTVRMMAAPTLFALKHIIFRFRSTATRALTGTPPRLRGVMDTILPNTTARPTLAVCLRRPQGL